MPRFMKTYFYPILIVLLSVLIISCKSNTQKEVNLNPSIKTTSEQKVAADTLDLNKLKTLETQGYFKTKDDKLFLNVPVTSEKFKIIEVEDISSSAINSIVIRVSDSTQGSILNEQATHIVSQVRKISSIPLDPNNLDRDGKLKVITFNSTNAFSKEDIKALKECIRLENNYNHDSCINSIRDNPIIPNDRRGTIIRGIN